MTIYFSSGFYDSALHSDIPADAVPLTEDEYADLMAGQSAGKQIVRGEGGRPMLVEPPPAPLSAPAVISDRQFFQGLALDGYITPAEALAAVRTGDLPPVLAELIERMDAEERFGAEMLLSGAVEFRRDHPMTVAIGEARGLTPDEVDDFFRRAAAL